jgi:hypothetical protein
MRDDRGAPVQLRHGAEIDGESELDVLTLPQAEITRLDEHARRAEIYGLAQPSPPTGRGDVHGGPSPMTGVQSTFHDGSLVGLAFIRMNEGCLPNIMPTDRGGCASEFT